MTVAELATAMADCREVHDLSVHAAATGARISAQTWTRIENGTSTQPRLDTRLRIQNYVQQAQPTPGRRDRRPTMSNRHDLSHGLIRCTVTTERPLPAAAYAMLAVLVEVIERTNQQLVDLGGEEPASTR